MCRRNKKDLRACDWVVSQYFGKIRLLNEVKNAGHRHADIIAILEKQDNVQGFIKDLIRKSSQ